MTNTKETANLGKWGRLHYDYLYRNKRTVLGVMRMKGTLQAYLEQFDTDTQDSYEKLVKRTAEVENVTGELKTTDQMEWVSRMNNIRNRSKDVILSDNIYQYSKRRGVFAPAFRKFKTKSDISAAFAS